MKTFKIAILIFFILIFNSTEINSQWAIAGNINTTQLNSVKFFDQNTGITVGIGGIWRTTDGGFNWTSVQNSGKLNSISFYDHDNGMVVGDSGKIYRTTDNGITWAQLNSGTLNNLNSVSTCNSSEPKNKILINYFSYIVGQNGIFLRSFNSGNTWSTGSAYTQDLYYIWIMNPGTGTGFTVGASNSETYFCTANGGTYWQPILNTTNGGYHLYSGAFLTGQNTCLCVGSGGRIRRTTNWGLNWVLPVSNTTYDLYSVTFPDASNGYLCGQNGFIEKSTNGGLNWSQQFAPTYNHLRCISFINNLTGWIIGDNGIVLRTNNGGLSAVHKESSEIPTSFYLYQNYPNPFNPITKIKFALPKNSLTKLIIIDLLGRQVATLVDEKLSAGIYETDWDGNNFASGIYFYKLVTQKLYGNQEDGDG